MCDRIETIFAACSSKTSKGSSPPFISLEDIIKNCKTIPDFLKIDCEGCEYDMILNSSEEVFQYFTYIPVEYHYGYRRMKSKLEKCGFQTKISWPTYFPHIKQQVLGTVFSMNFTRVETGNLEKPFIGYILTTKGSIDWLL